MAAEEDFEALGQESGQKRNAARTQERFPIEFQVIGEQEFLRLSNTYLEKRTTEREVVASGGGGEEFGEAFFAAGATQVQIQMFQQTMRAIRNLEHKVDELLASTRGSRSDDGVRMHKGMCVDLSATGMRMITAVPLEKGTIIRALLTLPPLHPVVVGVLGRIVKVGEVRLASGKKAREVACHFEAIHEDDREEIVAYSFKRQRQEAFKEVAGDGGEEPE